MSDDQNTHETMLEHAEHEGDLHIEKIAKAVCLMLNGCMGPDEWKGYMLMAARFNHAYSNLK